MQGGRVSQCLGVGWGCAIRGILAVQERDLQFKLVLCSARGGLMMGRALQCFGGLAMWRDLQFKEGSCFTVGVLLCVFEGPSTGGASFLEEEVLQFMDAPEMQRKLLGSSSYCLHFKGALAVLGAVLP